MAGNRRQKKIKNNFVEEEKKEEDVEVPVTKKEDDDVDLEYFKDVAESEEESDSDESEEETKEDEKEEKDEFQKGEKIIALDPKDEETIKNRVKKEVKSVSKDDNVKPGVIFLSHIPHGFYEKQMKEYFTQFGDVTRLRLSRNKKTGKSKHYAFIEFKNAQVAQIVAETMNNYLLYSHVLKCSVIPEDKLDPNTFVGANKKFKVIPWAEIERKKKQELKSGKKYQKNVKSLLKKDEKKRKRLQELGIDYEFSGYAANVKKQAKHTKFE